MSVLVLIISLAKTGLILIYKPDVGELAGHIATDKVDLQGIRARSGAPHLVNDIHQESGRGIISVGVLNVAAIGAETPFAGHLTLPTDTIVNETKPA